MGFVEAVKTCFRKFINFKGRAPRSEYWWWFLFTIIMSIFAAIIDSVVLGFQPLLPGQDVTIIHIVNATNILTLVLLLPGLAVSVRRLHDVNRTGWWIAAPYAVWIMVVLLSALLIGVLDVIGATLVILLVIIAIVYVIAILIWFFSKGTIGDNKYGPDPLAGQHKEESAPAE